MAISTQVLVDKIDEFYADRDRPLAAEVVLRELLEISLSPQEKRVIEFLDEIKKSGATGATSSTIAEVLNSTQTNTCNVLTRLLGWGLIERNLVDLQARRGVYHYYIPD